MRNLIFILITTSILISCVSKEDYEDLQQKDAKLIQDLRHENSKLKLELDEIKNSPDRIYKKVSSLLDSKDLETAKSMLDTFLVKYPEYRKEDRFSSLYENISSELLKRDQEREREQEQIAQEKKKKEQEINKFVKNKFDSFQKITWYSTTRNTEYSDGSNVTFKLELYFGQQSDNSKFFRLRSRYTDRRSDYHDTQWIFYETIHLLADNGSELVVDTKYPAKQSDNDSYGLTEWSDNLVSEIEVLPFAAASNIKVRFDGKYRNEFTMTQSQLKAFKEIISKYKSL